MTLADFEFRAWPKTPRLFRTVVITEKIDGTNACVYVNPDRTAVGAQSRNRTLTTDDDNYGFAAWVTENAGALADTLGPGYHYGEWWGSGIQRGYGLVDGERRFSLFNTGRWTDGYGAPLDELAQVDGLDVVPVLAHRTFDEHTLRDVIGDLKDNGSYAEPEWMAPEGIVVFHTASRQVYKVLIDSDEVSKTELAVVA